jgi:hypothetical protein
MCVDQPESIAAGAPWLVSIREIAADGTLTWRVDLPDLANFGTDMLFDTANGAIWAWTGTTMHLRRFDVATRAVADITFDRDAQTATGGERLGDKTPVWVRPDRFVPTLFSGQMAGSIDGSRLYLLGYATERSSSGPTRSVGIFVVDPRTMALVARWPTDASYVSIQVGLDGSVVMASGMAGVDDRGKPVPWDASVTFHDATSGRIVALYGRLGREGTATIVEP